MSQYHVLVARLDNELQRLDQIIATANNQALKANKTGDDDFLKAAALSLQNYYMGVERIFAEVAKQVDQSLPTGRNSHQKLLEQMQLEIPVTRPPVLLPETASQIDEFRAFRHVVMHRYGFELQPQRVRELVKQLIASHQLFSRDVQNFCQFLLQVERSL
ncbi:MAG: hypothetical protein AAGG53_05420 [Cyanobacteria bacterium P01_H01_bin.152]